MLENARIARYGITKIYLDAQDMQRKW